MSNHVFCAFCNNISSPFSWLQIGQRQYKIQKDFPSLLKNYFTLKPLCTFIHRYIPENDVLTCG